MGKINCTSVYMCVGVIRRMKKKNKHETDWFEDRETEEEEIEMYQKYTTLRESSS